MNKPKSTPKQTVKADPLPAKTFQNTSKFGGSSTQFLQKSQYKPTPVRITQHKG